MDPDYDLLVIGGGVNGAGIARDAAGRGMSVLLVEAQDLAGATSSASSKLVHGGLRYLEHFEFRLVRESLQEREVLLRMAPHIIRPLDFVLPHASRIRPAWMIRAGLYLYDRLGGREKLPESRGIDLRSHPFGADLQERYKKGFVYADCWVDDARLTVLNAVDAGELGAHIITRTACTGLRAEAGVWHAELRDTQTEETLVKTASIVVNAAGPWVRQVIDGNRLAIAGRTPDIRLVKGSHIIVPRIFAGGQAYILQQPDRRIVFALPYEGAFTLVGTTDVEYDGDPGKPEIDGTEKVYLCDAVNSFFRTEINPGQIIHTYSGVRPLLDDGRGRASEVTRDYHLELETSFGPPLLSVFGGKITTYRRLAQDVMQKIVPLWAGRDQNPGSGNNWTDTICLPGGDILDGDFSSFAEDQVARYPWMKEETVRRYANAYGTRMDRMLHGASGIESLGRHFGDGVYEAEVDHMRQKEWAKTSEDVLWRRSKLGLHISRATRDNIRDFMGR